MTTKIFKDTVGRVGGGQTITFPKGAKIISALMQGTTISLYAECPVEEPETQVISVCIFGTSHTVFDEVLRDYTFLQTIPDPEGYVWHVYYKVPS